MICTSSITSEAVEQNTNTQEGVERAEEAGRRGKELPECSRVDRNHCIGKTDLPERR
tara:strand:- start:263 stop:433 length:171 start_codon:yes stop_codon:yes gene_type:complete